MRAPRPDRRRFLGQAAAALAALPLLLVGDRRAFAQALKPLPGDLPQAVALKYSPVEAAVKDPAYKPGSSCANCQFFAADTRACQIFPGYAVKPNAWCSAWAKKA
jgi:hypothetical protein